MVCVWIEGQRMTVAAIIAGGAILLLTIAAYFSLPRKEFILGTIVIGTLVTAFVVYISFASGRGLTGLACDIVYGYKACEPKPSNELAPTP